VLFLGAFGAAWGDAVAVRWSQPAGMRWPDLDAAFVTSSGGNRGAPAAAVRPVVIVAAR